MIRSGACPVRFNGRLGDVYEDSFPPGGSG